MSIARRIRGGKRVCEGAGSRKVEGFAEGHDIDGRAQSDAYESGNCQGPYISPIGDNINYSRGEWPSIHAASKKSRRVKNGWQRCRRRASWYELLESAASREIIAPDRVICQKLTLFLPQ
jgi:hypothetical protein